MLRDLQGCHGTMGRCEALQVVILLAVVWGSTVALAFVTVGSHLPPPSTQATQRPALGSTSTAAGIHSRRRILSLCHSTAGGLFEPTYETRTLYRAAAEQLRELHGDKCRERGVQERDEAFWRDLDVRVQRPAAHEEAGLDLSGPASLWRFDHFLTKQKILALPLTGRTRIDGVSRRSLGPLKDLDEGRRQVRAAAHYPGLSHKPCHDFMDFAWLRALHARLDVMRTELEEYLRRPDSRWSGNNCQDFDQYGWTQISLNTFGQSHEDAQRWFPQTMALLANAPYGPRDLCIVRQRANSGLPRHSDQRNYILTAHIVLKSPNSPRQAPGAVTLPALPVREQSNQAQVAQEADIASPEIEKLRAKLKDAEMRLHRLKQSENPEEALVAVGSEGDVTCREAEDSGKTVNEKMAVAEAQAIALDQQFQCSLWCDENEQEWKQGAATVIDTTYWFVPVRGTLSRDILVRANVISHGSAR